MVSKFLESLAIKKKKEKKGKGVVSDSIIYSYCTAYCVVTCFGCYEEPSSKIN